MIDVSRFHAGDPCPRCAGRRVHTVSIETDEWCCIPFAMPFALAEHVRIHDATERLEDPEAALAALEHFHHKVKPYGR